MSSARRLGKKKIKGKIVNDRRKLVVKKDHHIAEREKNV